MFLEFSMQDRENYIYKTKFKYLPVELPFEKWKSLAFLFPRQRDLKMGNFQHIPFDLVTGMMALEDWNEEIVVENTSQLLRHARKGKKTRKILHVCIHRQCRTRNRSCWEKKISMVHVSKLNNKNYIFWSGFFYLLKNV